MKKFLVFALAAILAFSCLAFAACSGETNPGSNNTPGGQPPEGNESSTVDGLIDCYIEFSGTSYTTTDTSAIKVEGSALTIVKPGTYDLSGTLDNGQIIVEVTKADRVTLILNNFTGHNESSAVIWVKSADKVYLEVKTGTTNTLTDGATYVFEGAETKPNACIYASDDLSIKGHGTLIVTGNYNNAIGC